MMFSAAFAGGFAGRRRQALGFIGPTMAQAALVAGAGWSVVGSGLFVGGRQLIGPAGKDFVFASPETAARWANNARGAGIREAEIIAGLDVATRDAWKQRKREKLAVVAYRVINAAARQVVKAKQDALVAEAEYCFAKWGD